MDQQALEQLVCQRATLARHTTLDKVCQVQADNQLLEMLGPA